MALDYSTLSDEELEAIANDDNLKRNQWVRKLLLL
jgi:hypothetical protein